MAVASYPLPKEDFSSDKKKEFHFLPYYHYILKKNIFGHLMAYLNEKFHPSKTIVYLIKILQTDFEIPCNVMAQNPCTIPLRFS